MSTYEIAHRLVHYGMHFLLPLPIAWVFYRNSRKKTFLILLATMLVDLDHLLATPIFDMHRNSIGTHLFHLYPFIALYFILAIFGKGILRIVAIGLCLHMITDFQDYYFW